jgi:hypothetical protein
MDDLWESVIVKIAFANGNTIVVKYCVSYKQLCKLVVSKCLKGT